MRNSAVGQHPPTSQKFPTACPWCGSCRLAYQYEDGAYDAYQCHSCTKWVLVRDVADRPGSYGHHREIKRLYR